MVYPPSMERNQDNIHLPLQKCLKQILSEMLSLSRNADLIVKRAHWSHQRLSYWSSAADSSSALVEEGGGIDSSDCSCSWEGLELSTHELLIFSFFLQGARPGFCNWFRLGIGGGRKGGGA